MSDKAESPAALHRFALYRGRRGAIFFWGSIGVIALLFAGLFVGERRNVGREGSILGTRPPGDAGLYRDSDFVYVFRDPGLPKSLAHLPESDRERTSQEWQASGQIFRVLRGTKVLIVDHKFLGEMDQVRFLDGSHKGQVGWLFEQDLSYEK